MVMRVHFAVRRKPCSVPTGMPAMSNGSRIAGMADSMGAAGAGKSSAAVRQTSPS